jgi:hypothetical protein
MPIFSWSVDLLLLIVQSEQNYKPVAYALESAPCSENKRCQKMKELISVCRNKRYTIGQIPDATIHILKLVLLLFLGRINRRKYAIVYLTESMRGYLTAVNLIA